MKNAWTLKLTSLCLMMTVLSLSAFAGGVVTGGGQGVVCRDTSGKVKSVELFDLWEARQIHPDWKIIKSEKSVEQQVKEGIQRLRYAIYEPSFSGNIEIDKQARQLVEDIEDQASVFFKHENGENFSGKIVDLEKGTELTLTQDSFEDIQVSPNSGCRKEQLVSYKRTSLLMRKELIDLMDKTNRAALYLHESFYASLRMLSLEKSSVRVRKAIGYVMSGHAFASTEKEFASIKTKIVCESVGSNLTKFSIYQVMDEKKDFPKLIFHVHRIAGVLPLGETDFGGSYGFQGTYQDRDMLSGYYNAILKPRCLSSDWQCKRGNGNQSASVGTNSIGDDEFKFDIATQALNDLDANGTVSSKLTITLSGTTDHKNEGLTDEIACELRE